MSLAKGIFLWKRLKLAFWIWISVGFRKISLKRAREKGDTDLYPKAAASSQTLFTEKNVISLRQCLCIYVFPWWWWWWWWWMMMMIWWLYDDDYYDDDGGDDVMIIWWWWYDDNDMLIWMMTMMMMMMMMMIMIMIMIMMMIMIMI